MANGHGAAGIPDRRRCLEILHAEEMPEHIRIHSERVAEVALRLAAALNAKSSAALDVKLLEAGALLHDISKFHTIQYGGNHCAVGGERARELGLDIIAPLIERHVDIGEWDPEGPITEAELINYSDKRVCHTDIVTLEERFVDLLTRYGKTDAIRARITGHWETVKMMEEKIMKRLEEEDRF